VGVRDRVVVSGDALVDGAPFDSPSMGAVVLRTGLVTACQDILPRVANGRYTITVLADTESSGCGAPGAQIVLWTFANNRILYSTNALAWPGNGGTTTFAPRYSTSAPNGPVPPLAQFEGNVLGARGEHLRPGTRVDAYVGDTHCGTASLRSTDEFTGYILDVVGPESIAGCTRGATLAFRIDGRPAAATTVVNTPPGQRDALDLTLP
jgi:hypothetical protein